ncbi:hypothetical protein AB0N05_34750 [Nocardia sp. NPDC051030]|uniref:hypothetical protein n=1 Tax=Nocardia sp. NPDC051030 TaxID=3155162 RepID=UPI0034276B60
MKSLGALLVCAPLCIAGYGVIRLIGKADGQYGPGLDWQFAHLVGLLGLGLFIPVVVGLGWMLPSGGVRNAVVTVTLIGLAATIIQFGADVVFAAEANDAVDMSRRSDDFSAIPGIRMAIYSVGPQLFFLGLVVLTALLVRARRLPWWSPVVALASVLLPAVNLGLLPIAGVGLLAAICPASDSRTRQMSNV